MTNKTSKLIWPVPMMAVLAIIGALAVFAALGPSNANPAYAQPAMVPGATTDVVARPGNGKLTVGWMAPASDGSSPITGYKVQYKLAAATDYTLAATVSATTTKHVITGLTNSTTETSVIYNVQVIAVNRIGDSAVGQTVLASPIAVPTMPRNLVVAKYGINNQVTVSWDAPLSNGGTPINVYNWDVTVENSIGAGTFGSESTRTAEPPTFDPSEGGVITAAGATPGTPGCRTAMVFATTVIGPGDQAMVTCPSAPENFSKQVVDNVAILRWEPPSNLGSPDAAVMHYIVKRTGFERGVTNGAPMKGDAIDGEERQWTVNSSMTELWDTGLSHQTIYEYEIFAVTNRYMLGDDKNFYNTAGPRTAFTSTSGGLLLAPPSAPSAPTRLALASQCADKITLTWRAPTQVGGGVDPRLNRHWYQGQIVVGDAAIIDSYEVQYRASGTSSWKDLAYMGTMADVTSGLAYDKTYDFRVRATNNIGLSGPWASKRIELEDPGQPQMPRSFER